MTCLHCRKPVEQQGRHLVHVGTDTVVCAGGRTLADVSLSDRIRLEKERRERAGVEAS